MARSINRYLLDAEGQQHAYATGLAKYSSGRMIDVVVTRRPEKLAAPIIPEAAPSPTRVLTRFPLIALLRTRKEARKAKARESRKPEPAEAVA